MLNKIKFLLYSKKYTKLYSKKAIKKITNANYVLLGCQNGKTRLFIKQEYIRAVERYDFGTAKTIKKVYKKYFHRNIF